MFKHEGVYVELRKIYSNWIYKVFIQQQHYIFWAHLHYSIPAEYQWCVLLQCYCLVAVWMNPCGRMSCLYVYVHIVYKMGYTFVNGVDWWIKMFHFLSKHICLSFLSARQVVSILKLPRQETRTISDLGVGPLSLLKCGFYFHCKFHIPLHICLVLLMQSKWHQT